MLSINDLTTAYLAARDLNRANLPIETTLDNFHQDLGEVRACTLISRSGFASIYGSAEAHTRLIPLCQATLNALRRIVLRLRTLTGGPP